MPSRTPAGTKSAESRYSRAITAPATIRTLGSSRLTCFGTSSGKCEPVSTPKKPCKPRGFARRLDQSRALYVPPPMWRTPSLCLALLLLVSPAAARHRHHHGYRLPAFSDMPRDLEERAWDGRDRYARTDASEFVPPGWTLQPPDPHWTGKRFVSPD